MIKTAAPSHTTANPITASHATRRMFAVHDASSCSAAGGVHNVDRHQKLTPY
jgi:hypothetical protein